MTFAPIPFATKDNAQGRLNAGLLAASLSIPLQSGNGANFPQPYSSTATSLGSSTTLNCTGISATIGGSAQVGKIIYNLTDNSAAVILSVATDSLTTTRLLGGSDNTWQNSDRWCIDPFVLTLGVLNTSGYGVQSDGNLEEVLIIGRATDTLTVATGGRGYNDTTAQAFSSGDYAYLRVTSPLFERLKDILSVVAQQLDTERTTNATQDTSLTNILNASSFYAVTTGSTNSYAATYANITGPIAAGMEFFFKANFTNTGSATLTLTLGASAQSAKTIKKNDGATNLSANDIISGQIVHVRYDGTNLQLLSPVGTPAASMDYDRVVYLGASDSGSIGASSTSIIDFDTHTYTIPANDLINGVAYRVSGIISEAVGAGDVRIYITVGSTNMTDMLIAPSNGDYVHFTATIRGTAAASGSAAVRVESGATAGGTSQKASAAYGTANLATNGTLALKISHKFNTSNGSNAAILKSLTVKKISTTAF